MPDIPWDVIEKLVQVIRELIESCDLEPAKKEEAIRNPGPVVRYLVRRKARLRDLQLSDELWEGLFKHAADLSDADVALLLSDWSAF